MSTSIRVLIVGVIICAAVVAHFSSILTSAGVTQKMLMAKQMSVEHTQRLQRMLSSQLPSEEELWHALRNITLPQDLDKHLASAVTAVAAASSEAQRFLPNITVPRDVEESAMHAWALASSAAQQVLQNATVPQEFSAYAGSTITAVAAASSAAQRFLPNITVPRDFEESAMNAWSVAQQVLRNATVPRDLTAYAGSALSAVSRLKNSAQLVLQQSSQPHSESLANKEMDVERVWGRIQAPRAPQAEMSALTAPLSPSPLSSQ